MKYILLFLFIILAAFSVDIFSQEKDTINDASKTRYFPKIIGIPILFYGPETRLGFGAAGFFSFKTNPIDTILRPSQINLGAAYTLEKQVLTYASFDIWALQNKVVFNGEIGYYRYFYNFYGLRNEPRKVE